MKISANKLVSVDYELYVDGENGEAELVEKTTAERPLNFIFGAAMMLPKFEQNLYGLSKGDNFEFSLAAEDAYGDYIDENVIELERSVFEIDGKFDEKVIFSGNVITLNDGEGTRFQAEIVNVSPTHVTVDLNHPLAGETLHFKGQIREVRDPSEEEVSALLGNSCGCGCDECGEDCASC
ncbi:MAG: peptidylprolyl isomerase [Paludibacter sp.]|nr:peptidylprolyl isomerase [Paludibacter sp.]